MISEVLKTIFGRYSHERQQPFGGNLFADYIRKTVPDVFQSFCGDFQDIACVASPGKGNWASAPWIAFLADTVTGTPTKGYYPVYLFDSLLSKVFLSYNQGVTILKEEFSLPVVRELLHGRAKMHQAKL